LFFSSLQEFLSIYGNSTATGDDLKDVLNTETSIDFDPFFNEWYYGEGYPIYSVEWYQAGSTLHIESTQTTTSPATTLFTIPIEFKITYEDDSEEIIRKNVDANFSSYEVPVTGIITEIETNPSIAVLADVSTVQKSENNRIPDRLKVFPNPSNGTFTVFTNFTEDYNIQLIDITGKTIKNSTSGNQILSIDFSDVNAGVYFLKMSTEKESYLEKIIIQ
jgi:aminopeptidase N